MNYSEEYSLALKVLRLERERATGNSNQAPVQPAAPSAVPPAAWNARVLTDATVRALERYQKVIDAIYGRNQDPLKPGASPREVFEKLMHAIYQSKRY